METLKTQAAHLRRQLSGLDASQRMLAGALVVIMAMTMLWWARFASSSEMVALLGDQPVSQTDLARMPVELRARGIDVRVDSDRILVPVTRQIEAMAVLGYSDLLPADTSKAYDQIIDQHFGSPWESATVTRERVIAGRAAAMRQVLRTMQDVRDAHVLLNIEPRRGYNDTAQPSGAVHITTRSGKPNRVLAQAARNLVAGGTGIAASRVNVSIDDVAYRDDAATDGMYATSDQMAQAAAYEKRFVDKIQEQLSHIPGAKATVTVQLDARSTQQTSRRFDPANTISKEGAVHTRREETITYGNASPESGIATDFVDPTDASASAKGTVAHDQDTTNELLPSFTDEKVSVPAGRLTTVAAGVQIPMSYFRRQWSARNPGQGEPTDAALQPIIDAGQADIEAIVRACLGGDGISSEVSVRTYADLVDPVTPPVAEASVVSASLASMLDSHARQIAIGLLAVISLVVVSQLARRSVPQPVALHGEHAASGASYPRRNGRDSDPDADRTQQVVDQIKTLAREDPDAAAGIVRRWMDRS